MGINVAQAQARAEARLFPLIAPERLGPMQTAMETGRYSPQAQPCYRWDVRGTLTPAEIAALEAAGFSVTDWEADGYEATGPDAPRYSIGGPDDE